MMKVVESNAGQSAFELYEVLTRSVTPRWTKYVGKIHTNGNMQSNQLTRSNDIQHNYNNWFG